MGLAPSRICSHTGGPATAYQPNNGDRAQQGAKFAHIQKSRENSTVDHNLESRLELSAIVIDLADVASGFSRTTAARLAQSG
jgi:hypothetical protein